MSRDRSVEPPKTAPHAPMERALISEYLESNGHTVASLGDLPAAEMERLLRDASVYASSRLTEIESRARLVADLQGETRLQSARARRSPD